MATSFDALEALLQFHEGVSISKTRRSSSHHLAVPVPNPLDPTQPHLIEGDTPNVTPRATDAGVQVKGDVSSMPMTGPVVTTVPNPLMTPMRVRGIEQVLAVTSSSATRFWSCESVPLDRTTSPNIKTPDAASVLAPEERDRTDRILVALNSMPQRGKKRQNLNEIERQELTKIRNREHAKSTR